MLTGYHPTTYHLDGNPSRECPAWLHITVHPADVGHAPVAGGPHDAAFEVPARVEFHSLLVDGSELPAEAHGALDDVEREILALYEAGELELLGDVPVAESEAA